MPVQYIKRVFKKCFEVFIRFVYKGLGANGQEILREENKKYSDKTFLKRKLLINKLFELLEN